MSFHFTVRPHSVPLDVTGLSKSIMSRHVFYTIINVYLIDTVSIVIGMDAWTLQNKRFIFERKILERILLG